MSESNPGSSPLEAAERSAGPRATEAFSVLGNETRLSILLALWEAFEPFAIENAVSFSELRERVGIRDSGQFNYHLGKLEGQFIEKADGGYMLRRAGQQLVRTVIAGAGIEEPTLEPTEIDNDCPFCGAPTAVTYEDEWLYIVCTACEGFFGGSEGRPDGMLSGAAFDPAGFSDRSPGEMWTAAWIKARKALQSAVEGVCDACSGPMERSLDVCDDHGSEGICDNCGRRFGAMARFRCPVCKNHHTSTPRTLVAEHPAVIAFYYERGVPLQYETVDFESGKRAGNLVGNHEQEVVSTDPVRVRIVVDYADDTLELVVDESLSVLEISHNE